MRLEILGTGCKKCEDLAEKVKAVAESEGINFSLEKVTDIQKIMQYGVMMTPALVVDGVVKVYGKIPSSEEIKDYLTH